MEVAFMYDFDGTLSPLNMQDYNFIPALNMDSESFWKNVSDFKISKNMDPILSYMYMMIKKAKEKDISITKKAFISYGKGVELFPGVLDYFSKINDYAKSIDVSVKHYIISSGIKEIIEGTEIKDKFEIIYASSFLYSVDGVAIWPATSINYTNKTQFIYRINKGIFEVYDDMINEHMDDDKKKIDFKNMVYFGDGLTDIPCMKLVKNNGGNSIAVYSSEKSKNIANTLLKENRVNNIFTADYTETGELFIYLKDLLLKLKNEGAKNAI